jgi:hypothetical protein
VERERRAEERVEEKEEGEFKQFVRKREPEERERREN